ncbi:filamentous hemagglutinin N-terminal domain-containing protein [Serratia ureilytica]
MILNEVIGRNPSLLHGQQEIFGMAADYVLANPNGISCRAAGSSTPAAPRWWSATRWWRTACCRATAPGQPQYPEPQRRPERRRRAGSDRAEDRQPRRRDRARLHPSQRQRDAGGDQRHQRP